MIQESKRPSFNKLRYFPANLEQLESCNERARFHYLGSGTVRPSATVVYVHRRSLALGSHGGRCKFIIVIVSPLEALMLDVAETFRAMDTSHTNFVSQHHSSGLPCYSLYCLPKVAVALSNVLSNDRFVTSIFTGSGQYTVAN